MSHPNDRATRRLNDHDDDEQQPASSCQRNCCVRLGRAVSHLGRKVASAARAGFGLGDSLPTWPMANSVPPHRRGRWLLIKNDHYLSRSPAPSRVVSLRRQLAQWRRRRFQSELAMSLICRGPSLRLPTLGRAMQFAASVRLL